MEHRTMKKYILAALAILGMTAASHAELLSPHYVCETGGGKTFDVTHRWDSGLGISQEVVLENNDYAPKVFDEPLVLRSKKIEFGASGYTVYADNGDTFVELQAHGDGASLLVGIMGATGYAAKCKAAF
jgi:hypothetical protein